MDINKVLLSNYLPYAKGVIIGRAIPSIDGLKPAQRKILYTMYKMGLLRGNKTKSSNIIGQTMKIHPHGDMSIYETMVRMSTGNEALNVPYVDSKGNFGKIYSKELAFAAPRYTEAKLAEICEELFDGIEEGAVDMINNFDDTMLEPTLLPTKFPAVLVNTSSGIAVSTSSNIPSFDLKAVCDATIGMLKGTVTDVESLMDIIGTPEFTTGGHLHTTRDDLIELGKTGKATFTVSGSVTTYPNKIEILEIPYRTTAEAIIAAIEEYAKSGELREVSNVSDEIDLNGFKLVVELKRGSNPQEVLAKLCRLTTLRMQMSFITRVIIADRCEELGIYELLEKWIGFRIETIDRIHKFRLNKAKGKEHLLEAWEKIKDHVREVARTVADNEQEEVAKQVMMSTYNLDDEQAEYLLDNKFRMINQENLKKKLKELAAERAIIQQCNNVISSEDVKRNIIIEDLTRIGNKYGKQRKTLRAEPVVDVYNPNEDAKQIDDTLVNVILTKSGYIKRLVSLRDISNFELPDGEVVDRRWAVKNNEYILVFTYSGECHKILVDSIDASRSGLKDKVSNILLLPNEKDILFIDTAGDYSGYFNVVYPNGRGLRVNYNRVAGSRVKYKSLYDEGEYGKLWVTKSDKFFMITAKRKAAYTDLKLLGAFSNRVAFKVARISAGDYIFGLQPVENVPDISKIDIARYNKDYCVSIGDDVLWHGAKSSTQEKYQEQKTSPTEATNEEDAAKVQAQILEQL